GSNEPFEIESLEEFLAKVPCISRATNDRIPLRGFVFQAVDLSSITPDLWANLDVEGAVFLGCTFPSSTSAARVSAGGALVLEEHTNLPFRQFISHLYSQAELHAIDAPTYAWYLQRRGQ